MSRILGGVRVHCNAAGRFRSIYVLRSIITCTQILRLSANKRCTLESCKYGSYCVELLSVVQLAFLLSAPLQSRSRILKHKNFHGCTPQLKPIHSIFYRYFVATTKKCRIIPCTKIALLINWSTHPKTTYDEHFFLRATLPAKLIKPRF